MLRPTNENRDKLMQMLLVNGYTKDELNEVMRQDFTKPFFFFIGSQPTRIDFLTHISLVTFDEAFEKRKSFDIEGFQIPVLHIHHLALSKITTGRPKDKQDIDELQRIMRENPEK